MSQPTVALYINPTQHELDERHEFQQWVNNDCKVPLDQWTHHLLWKAWLARAALEESCAEHQH